MANERIHIVPHDQGWALKREGSTKIESEHKTQQEALDAGRDLARKDEADIVVHRQDGTFRNVLTFTSDPMNGKNNGNDSGTRAQTQDLFSVGSRISWGAVVAGAAIALTMNAVLWMGGVALGITVSDQVTAKTLTVGAALWMMASTLASLFVGGFVVSRLTAGENHEEAVMYGVSLWGFMFAFSLILAGMGVNTGAQLASLKPASSTATNLNDEALSAANLTAEQRERYESKLKAAREDAGELSATAAAWWGFTALALSLCAAIGGAWLGAGPDFILVQRPVRQSAMIQPST